MGPQPDPPFLPLGKADGMKIGGKMKASIFALLAACLAGAAAHADCAGTVGRDLPVQPIGVSGISARDLLTINHDLDRAGLDIRALLVVSDCRLVFERYRSDLDRENIHTLYSVTKSVTATLAGALMLNGKLSSLDISLSSLIKKPSSISEDDWKKAEQITLRNALGMTSGLETIHNPLGGDILYSTAIDRVLESLKPALTTAPGARFLYSDRNAALYGAALEGAAKTGLYNVARDAIFQPMDFGKSEWSYRDRQGHYPGGWALRLRAMDLAKFGQLYLQGGTWNGRPIMPPGFVDTLWTPGPAANYGLGWWIATSSDYQAVPLRYADGVKGQRVLVFPRHKTVAVVVSSLTTAEERSMTVTVARGMARALRSRAAPDAEGERQLAELAKAGFSGTTRVTQQAQDQPGR